MVTCWRNTDKLRDNDVSIFLIQSNPNWFKQLQSRVHEISSNWAHLTRIWAREQLQKFCKHKQVSSHLIFKSNSSRGSDFGGRWGGGGGDAGNGIQLLQLYWEAFHSTKHFGTFEKGAWVRKFCFKVPWTSKYCSLSKCEPFNKHSGYSRSKNKWNRNS